MSKIQTQLTAEIKQLEADIDAQKRAIRHTTTKGSAFEDAERNLRQLRTRLTALETNLRKCDPHAEGEVPGRHEAKRSTNE
jgi:septal ring factor EnvC (AmiA/AmiB activator)